MGLFTPGWQKNPEKAKKRIQETNSPIELYQIVTQTKFPDPEGIKVRSKAIARLGAFRRMPAGHDALEKLAKDGKDPLIRCQAAYELGASEGRPYMTKDIAAAYADRGVFLIYASENWIRILDDQAAARAAYDAAPDDLKKLIAPNVPNHHRDLMLHILLTVKEEKTARAVMKNFVGSPAQYARIVRESPSPSCRQAAIKGLDLSEEALLRKLADQGEREAAYRLLDLDTVKYAKVYPKVISSKQMIKAIQAGVYTDQELEKLAMDSNDISSTSVAWAAVKELKDPEILERILLTRSVPAYSKMKGGPWEPWSMELIRRLKDQEDVMARYILTENPGRMASLEEAAGRNIQSKKLLRAVAMESNYAAMGAAHRLGDSEVEFLRGSKHKGVAEWAHRRWDELHAASATEEEAIGIISWTLNHSNDKADPNPLCMKALERVKSQDGLIAVLKAIGFTFSAKAFQKTVLDRITDGAKLIDHCFDDYPYKPIVERLRTLIKDTPLEQQFTQRAVEAALREAPELKKGSSALSTYYDIPYQEALWRFAGERYPRRLIELMETVKEKPETHTIIVRLKDLYQAVPESHAFLEPYRGRQYTKHADNHDDYCGGRNYNRMDTLTLDFFK